MISSFGERGNDGVGLARRSFPYTGPGDWNTSDPGIWNLFRSGTGASPTRGNWYSVLDGEVCGAPQVEGTA